MSHMITIEIKEEYFQEDDIRITGWKHLNKNVKGKIIKLLKEM